MANREKVLYSLSCCSNPSAGQNCIQCYYRHGDICIQDLTRDAAELLNEQEPKQEPKQEPRVLTLEEIKDGEPYWFGAGKEFVVRPVICVHREDDAQKPYITFVWEFGTFSWMSEDYGKAWRVWSAKPTVEQRKEVEWDVVKGDKTV